MKRLLRYVRGTSALELELSLCRPRDSIEVLCIADAAWASGADRKSVSGGVLMIDGMVMETFSKTQ
eukprot:10141393-Heterocapsa_arctica.AAC.1